MYSNECSTAKILDSGSPSYEVISTVHNVLYNASMSHLDGGTPLPAGVEVPLPPALNGGTPLGRGPHV